MDLLQKFAGVEVKEDAHITEADKHFCTAHQAAYDNARSALPELLCMWEDMQSQQTELLAGTDTPSTFYLSSGDNIEISKDAIREQIFSLHSLFIGKLVSYFNKTYHLSLSITDMEDILIPQKPADKWTDDYEDRVRKYTEDMLNLSLRYTDILSQIYVYTDGRELSEQALHELKGKCHLAAWRTSNGQACFTQKKSTLLFNGYACSYQDRYGGGYWELAQSTNDILQGIAHFETGNLSCIPGSLANIIGKYSLHSDFYELYGCEKVQSLKLYKNRRVDIKFTTEEYARQFISEYLGDIC